LIEGWEIYADIGVKHPKFWIGFFYWTPNWK